MKKGIQRKKQPFAYAKKGDNGKWYHWTQLAGKLAQGILLGSGFTLAKWFISSDFFTDIFEDVKSCFKL